MEIVRGILEKAESVTPPPLKPFTKEVIEQFKRLGDDQRGRPESAMIKVQFTMGGGVLNPVVEHVGDLTHRMTMNVQYVKPDTLPTASNLGYEFVADKVTKTLRWLRNGYGFDREFRENIINNAAARKEDVKDLRERLDTALAIYAREHEKLHVWNQAQWLARGAAIALGYKAWDSAESYLSSLKTMCNNEKDYVKWAGDYTTDRHGNLIAKR